MPDTEKDPSPVGIPNMGFESMSELWGLIHDLLGGTTAMRDAGQKWLPIEPAEGIVSYEARLDRSILYNGYEDTVNKLSNRPFTREIIVTDLPADLSYLETDVDGNNKPLEVFIKEVLENLIKYGVAHIYVDHSELEDIAEGAELTIEDEKRLGARVYLVNISPANLIGWQTAKVDKVTELTQIRIRETSVEADGDYGDKEVVNVNVYSKEGWEVHEQDPDDEDKYTLVDSGTHTFGRIPLITIYANKSGYMTAKPPMMSLAWLNLAHWQSYSDQRHILRFSRFGLIFGWGLPTEMVKKASLEIGPTKAYLVESEHAGMKYVEHTGKSIDAGLKDIQDIEIKMRVLGNQPLMKEKPGTATAERIDEDRTVSQLQTWVHSLERGINRALHFACEWRSLTPKETMNVEVYTDFEGVILGGTDKELLLKMRQAGEITRERFLKEEQRRDVLSQDMDPATEAEDAAKEEAEDLSKLLPVDSEEEFEVEEE